MQCCGANFEHDEGAFRGGFEAALQLRNRNRSYEDCYQELAERDARVDESEVFRRGYERGPAVSGGVQQACWKDGELTFRTSPARR